MFHPITPSMAIASQDLRLIEEQRVLIPVVVRVPRPRLHERILSRVGRLMVFTGLDLLERYEPALSSSHETYPTAVGRAGV